MWAGGTTAVVYYAGLAAEHWLSRLSRGSAANSRTTTTGKPCAVTSAERASMARFSADFHRERTFGDSGVSDFLRIAMTPPPITRTMPKTTKTVGARFHRNQSISAVKTMTV